jgi:5-formyltetrahydrofolate cyclo-ligase
VRLPRPGTVERMDEAIAAQKLALRDQLLTVRRRFPFPEVPVAASAIADHLLTSEPVRRAATIAAYVSTSTEPGTGPLIERLHAMGRRVILPVLLPDNDLDWAAYTGPQDLVAAGRGVLEPFGPRLGVDAVATADVVLTPAVAVDRTGMRLGRGGGSYDRVLARVPVGTFVCALLYDGEVVEAVPADRHDRPVSAVVTPSGVTGFPVT